MAPDLIIAAGTHSRFLGSKKPFGDRFERVAGPLPAFCLVSGGILTELHLCMELGDLFTDAELDDVAVGAFDGGEALQGRSAER